MADPHAQPAQLPANAYWRLCGAEGQALGAFSSQVESLGGSENAINETSIFKPSGIPWLLRKFYQTKA
jgi:hypothetical protein